MRWHQLGMVVAALGCMTAPAFSQLSAVGNPGFETVIAYDVPPAVGNWTAFFGGPPAATLAALVDPAQFRSGAQSLRLSAANAGGSFCGVQQPATGVEPFRNYTIRFWAKKGVAANNGAEYRVEWRNAAGAVIGDPFANNQAIQTQLTDQWQQFQWTGAAPSDAAGASLVFAVQTFTVDPLNPTFNTEMFIDDVEFVLSAVQPPLGSCCAAGGSCTVTVQAACTATFTLNGTCTPNSCAGAPGACCNRTTAACVFVDPAVCTALGGEFRGSGVACTPNPCTVTICAGDFNRDTIVNLDDIFQFLNAWFAGCP